MSMWGPCIKAFPEATNASSHKNLYLSFDDGPDPIGTPATLAILERFQVHATFFVVAREAKKYPHLIKRIIASGHSIGNHSLDHSWKPFFRNPQGILAWIQEAETILEDLIGSPTVGFRSPAGVCTPPLHWALKQLNMPLIHWNVRFYDTVFPWNEAKALQSLSTSTPGSIILLHDKQRRSHRQQFLSTLESYLSEGRALGLYFPCMSPTYPFNKIAPY